MTLVEPSEAMLAISKRLNPDCEHVQGDMRTVRLGREFDAVFIHDAVCYMTTEADLNAAMTTGRGMRYLEWKWDPDPADTTYIVDYAVMLREHDGSVRVEHDRHVEGLFARTDWMRLSSR